MNQKQGMGMALHVLTWTRVCWHSTRATFPNCSVVQPGCHPHLVLTVPGQLLPSRCLCRWKKMGRGPAAAFLTVSLRPRAAPRAPPAAAAQH